MCAVSAIMDQARTGFYPQMFTFPPEVTRQEFNDLLAKVETLEKLLKAAKEYDIATNQPDCEDPSKTKVLKDIYAKLDEIAKRLHD